MKKFVHVFGLLVALSMLLAACGPKTTPTPAVVGDNEPYLITCTMDYTNAFIGMIFEEHAVALVDMFGFVVRDDEWEIPVASQTLGFMSM